MCPTLKGCGIDIDPKKIAAAQARGFEAKEYNILDLPNRKLTSFVTMSHFLEHLSSVNDAEKMIRKAVAISRNFVFIRHPWFSSDDALLSLGLKFYWSDWAGHKNHMSVLEFYKVLRGTLEKKLISSFEIFGRNLIPFSSSELVLPLQAPRNRGRYKVSLDGPKRLDIALPPSHLCRNSRCN